MSEADTARAQPVSAPAAGYRVLARKYRPATFDDLIGQEAMVRTHHQCLRDRAHSAGLDSHRRARRRQDDDRPHSRPRPELRSCPTGRSRRRPSTCRPSACIARPIMDSRHVDVLEMDAASHNGVDDIRQINDAVRYAPVERPLQGLHPRRSAHALEGGLQCAAEDAGGAAAPRQVHLRDHGNPQSPGHGAVALPALRPAPRRDRPPCRSSRRHPRQGRGQRGTGSACADRPRGRRLGSRFALAARPGDLARGGRGARRGRAQHARPRRSQPHHRLVRCADAAATSPARSPNCATSTIPAPTRWSCSPTLPSSRISSRG